MVLSIIFIEPLFVAMQYLRTLLYDPSQLGSLKATLRFLSHWSQSSPQRSCSIPLMNLPQLMNNSATWISLPPMTSSSLQMVVPLHQGKHVYWSYLHLVRARLCSSTLMKTNHVLRMPMGRRMLEKWWVTSSREVWRVEGPGSQDRHWDFRQGAGVCGYRFPPRVWREEDGNEGEDEANGCNSYNLLIFMHINLYWE